MEQKPTRKEKAAETKRKIFETAVRLIKENGYNNVTVSGICKSAGVAKGSFYVHYNSKEDIVRDSYYTDMSEYMRQNYAAFLDLHPNASYNERIICFMNLELKFAEYAGYEITCLAYTLNLGTCIPGPSEHLAKRKFSKYLYDAIQKNDDKNSSSLSSDEIFYYFESVIRGLMATWCFSNNSFSIVEKGEKYIPLAVYSIYTK
ncbi:MAG: TetR/AcrR family transcriptional regulator [Oscillibacter sp.]|nr:TetR/AcrR family transcriptional regulator [Oscillibacter sp.]